MDSISDWLLNEEELELFDDLIRDWIRCDVDRYFTLEQRSKRLRMERSEQSSSPMSDPVEDRPQVSLIRSCSTATSLSSGLQSAARREEGDTGRHGETHGVECQQGAGV